MNHTRSLYPFPNLDKLSDCALATFVLPQLDFRMTHQETMGGGLPMSVTTTVQLSPTLYALSRIFSLKMGGKPVA